jgi:acylphosphatase
MNGEAADRKAIRLRVRGKVQGVWYRAWTIEQASARGLDGWVRNRLDGSVEALLVGEVERVEAMISLCHEGPPDAEVTAVEVESAQGITPRGFSQKPTV